MNSTRVLVVHAKGPGVNKVQVNDETQVRDIVKLRDGKVVHEIEKHREENELRQFDITSC